MYDCRKMLSHFEFFNRFAIRVSLVVFQFVTIEEELRLREIESFRSSSKSFSMGIILE